MTTDQAGGQRAADNQQRAAELCAWARSWVVEGATSDGLVPYRDRIAAALDEAEARGRAEVVAKVEALAANLRQHLLNEAPVWETQFNAGPGLVLSVSDAVTVTNRHLRALVADVPGAQTDGEAGRG